MKTIVFGITAGIILLLGIIFASMYISSSNKEIALRNQVEAKQEVCKAHFDKMWKIIKQKAQVKDSYKNSFDTIYTNIMKGRYSNGSGQLMNWIKESNPNFDSSIFKDLMRSIEDERTEYFYDQQSLIDIHREHKTFINQFPQSIWLASKGETRITIVTSEVTESAYVIGQENDIKL